LVQDLKPGDRISLRGRTLIVRGRVPQPEHIFATPAQPYFMLVLADTGSPAEDIRIAGVPGSQAVDRTSIDVVQCSIEVVRSDDSTNFSESAAQELVAALATEAKRLGYEILSAHHERRT